MPDPHTLSHARSAPRPPAAVLGIALAVLLSLAPAGRALADPESAYWLSVGIGAGSLGSGPGGSSDFGRFASEMGGFVQRGSRVVGVRASSTDGPNDTDGWDVGALVGLATPAGRWHAALAGGLGYASRTLAGPPTGEDRPRHGGVCLPLHAEVTFRPFYLVGVGGFAYASLKSGASAAAVGAVVQLGRLR